MSIVITDLSYQYPNQDFLFQSLSLTFPKGKKISVIGKNGSGKSTLLKLISQELALQTGNVACNGKLFYIPQQHHEYAAETLANVLQVAHLLHALNQVTQGSTQQKYYALLTNNWDIESRCQAALNHWGIEHLALNTCFGNLSGGEKTKVFMAALHIHSPDIIVLDEPTNHLDHTARKQLYQFIQQSYATFIIVSHDVALLEITDLTCELSLAKLKLYGGNYYFYQEQKEIEKNALTQDISTEEKKIKLAKKKAQEIKQRQERRIKQGESQKGSIPSIVYNNLKNRGEQTSAKLKDKHLQIIEDNKEKLRELRRQEESLRELKLDLSSSALHKGKLLLSASNLNYQYKEGVFLWKKPVNLNLYSGQRLHIRGNNGSGKSTLVHLLRGKLQPACGALTLTHFTQTYLDQEYTQIQKDLSIIELAWEYNTGNLPEHELKTRLNRAVFPAESWTKNCLTLSGGEKMRLYLCCLMLAEQAPDLIILDEPTNNIDLTGLHILTHTLKSYKGSLIIISHDKKFTEEINITHTIDL